jgi:ubiquinone/menaquinone biosynthesis C-methylase UbiE
MRKKRESMWDVTERDFEIIDSWGLEKDPFKAISDYSERKKELRWLNPENREAFVRYIQARVGYIQDKDFDNYYKKASKPIDLFRWKFLIKCKAWFVMPLGWEKIAIDGKVVADMGCGDGDHIQRLIDFIDNYWKKYDMKERKIHIIGMDLNESRIENAKNHVKSTNPNITFEFFSHDISGKGLEYSENYFDYSLTVGVLEILDDKSCEKFLNEMCRTTSKGIYISDLAEQYPGGHPRDNINDLLSKRGFDVKEKHVVLSEPFDIEKLQNPLKLWPYFLQKNIWAEKI